MVLGYFIQRQGITAKSQTVCEGRTESYGSQADRQATQK